MYDFFKVNVTNIPEDRFHGIEGIKITQEVDANTGEMKKYKGELDVPLMYVHASHNYQYIRGSFHQLYNALTGKDPHNHDQFTVEKFYTLLHLLTQCLGEEILRSDVQCLEWGLNLAIDAERVHPCIIRHRYKFLTETGYGVKGHMSEVRLDQYRVKLYNKSKHFKQDDPITRIEVSANQSDYVKSRLGRSSLVLGDLLRRDIRDQLKADLLRHLDNYLIIDTEDRPDDAKFIERCNPRYWEEIKRKQDNNEINSKTFSRRWNWMNKKAAEYGLDSTRKELRKLIIETWEQLENVDMSFSDYVAEQGDQNELIEALPCRYDDTGCADCDESPEVEIITFIDRVKSSQLIIHIHNLYREIKERITSIFN